MEINANKRLPTNIITGFLGVGKTTAILHLLAHKPKDERWAILVNEFGEVGVDGKFFSGEHQEKTGVYIKEVAGGCMCCTAGLSMQMSLSLLLARAKPDRLFIEPSGLGHPREVLSVLSAGYYSNVLDLRATITLVDARKIRDAHYTDHDIFNQQLEIADVIVANKADTYAQSDFMCLSHYLTAKQLLVDKLLYSTRYGEISTDWLDKKSSVQLEPNTISEAPVELKYEYADTVSIPECGYLKLENKGEGFHSMGWLFESSYKFDRIKLVQLLHSIDTARLKAVFSTDRGVYGYNKADDVLTEVLLDEIMDNRIEIISYRKEQFDGLPLNIIQCCVKDDSSLGFRGLNIKITNKAQ